MKKYIISLCIILMPVMAFAFPSSDLYVIQWSAIGTSTADAVPDETATLDGDSTGTADKAMSTAGAYSISLSCSTLNTDVTNVSTDIDIDVLASQDGTNYDASGGYYVEDCIVNLGDNEQDTCAITPGPKFMKLRLDNDDASNTAGVKCRMQIHWR